MFPAICDPRIYAQSIIYRQSRPYSSDDGNEFHGDFDQGLERINSYYQGSAGGAYIVRVGDTLSGIAANLWGDTSLWYKIAEANGLSANAELDEGQVLSLPTGAMRNSYNASTFDPYNPAAWAARHRFDRRARHRQCGDALAHRRQRFALVAPIARQARS